MCWLLVPNRTQSRSSGVLLHIWNLPNEITLKQSCCSGVAPDLGYTVLLQRCCSRSDISWFFANILLWFSSPQVSQVSGAFLRFHQQVFFLSYRQSGHFWNLITQFVYVGMISRPPERPSSWIQHLSPGIYWPVHSPVVAAVSVSYTHLTLPTIYSV